MDKVVTLSQSIVSRRLGKIGPVTKSTTADMLRRAFDLK
jgi:hypothetical protein